MTELPEHRAHRHPDTQDHWQGRVGDPLPDDVAARWQNCDRTEAIRQAEWSAGQLRYWIQQHDARRDERDAVEARVRAQVAEERAEDHRLMNQTRAALAVALYHLRDRPGLLDDDAHEQREDELAGCRVALEEVEAVVGRHV